MYQVLKFVVHFLEITQVKNQYWCDKLVGSIDPMAC